MKPRAWEWISVHLALFVASAVVLYPLLWVLKLALESGARISSGDAMPLPSEPTLDNFRTFLGQRDFYGRGTFAAQLGNSLLISGAATVIGLMFALSAAYGFSRFQFPAKRQALSLMLISQMFPAVVTALPLLFILESLGLFGTRAGLVLVYSTTSVPFSIWMLKGHFDTIPPELDEAARLDGATEWQTFTRVLLPLVRPAIGLTGLFSFMTAYNEFMMASIFLDDVSKYTLPITLQQSVGGFDPNWGVFAAGSIVFSVPVVALFFFVQRQMIAGALSGAVKG